jgi:arylsulfatase A-like enzyme
VVAGDYKYTYWWFENDEMKATEELFDLGRDPFELTNLAGMKGSAKVLAEMRDKYDARVKHWNTEAVNLESYGRYGTLFDRRLPMAMKKKFLRGKGRK